VGKKVTLTEAGEAFLLHAQRVLDEMRSARATLQSAAGWGFRKLRIAMEPALEDYFVRSALLEFHRQFPKALLQVDIAEATTAREMLHSNRVDLVFSAKPTAEEGVEFIPMFADRFLAVVNPKHDWAEKSFLPPGEASRERCFLPKLDEQTRGGLDDYLEKYDFKLNVVAEIDSTEIVKEFVRSGNGIGILPGWMFRSEKREGSLVGLQLGRKPFDKTWGCSHLQRHPLSTAESDFMKLCGKALGNEQ
jgi:DNA-binding transcriptional LysR family regulator